MNKKEVIFYSVIILLLTFIPLTVASDFITGRATSDSFNIGVTVIGLPTVIIEKPQNKTYLVTTIEVQYSTGGDSDNENYSIDSGANNAITGNTNITFSTGTRHLQMWANNSYGSGTDNVYFTINTNLLSINYTNYNTSTKGNSTRFYDHSYEELQAFNNTTLEHTSYGKIIFNETINITADENYSDGNVDIDTHINISNASVNVNSTALPNFNVSATISLYNLTPTDPQILRDGEECPDTICTILNYSGGTLNFTVTHFSTYSVIETEAEAGSSGSSSGGGGGGGGGGSEGLLVYDFDIISPGAIEVGLNDEIVIPIHVVNNEENIILQNILLSVEASDPSLDPELQYTLIETLEPGTNETILLFISSDAQEGNYEIDITANVESPIIKETETLFLKTVEILGKTEVLERIVLAQELFRENPECLELNDLLIQAETLVQQERINEAKTLVQETILKCRDLVTNKEFPNNNNNFKKFEAWRTPIEITLILIIITFIILSLLRRKQHLNLTTAKKNKQQKEKTKKRNTTQTIHNKQNKKEKKQEEENKQ